MTPLDAETQALMYPFFTEEIREKVIAIVRADLENSPYRDQYVFDPIVVEPDYDLDGEDSLHIYVVTDGDFEQLPPSWTARLVSRIRPMLIAQGLPHRGVIKSFLPKWEWEERHLYFEDTWGYSSPNCEP